MRKRGRPVIRPKDNKPLGFIEIETSDKFSHLRKATPSAELRPLHSFSAKEIEEAELIIPSFLKP